MTKTAKGFHLRNDTSKWGLAGESHLLGLHFNQMEWDGFVPCSWPNGSCTTLLHNYIIYYSIRSIPFIIQPEGAGGCTVIHPGSICRKHVAADAVFPFHASDGEASHQHGDDKPQIVVPALLYEPTAGTIAGPAPSFHMRPCPISLARRGKQCRAPTGAKERPKNTSPTLAS